MEQPHPAPPVEVEGVESPDHLDALAWDSARAAVAFLAWAIAALIPLEPFVRGLIIGVSCLAAIGLLALLLRTVRLSLAFGALPVFYAGAATTAFGRFAVPVLGAHFLFIRIGSYVLFLAVLIGMYVVYARWYRVTAPADERPDYWFWRDIIVAVTSTGVQLAALYLLARFYSLTMTLLLVGADVVTAFVVLSARKALGAEVATDRRQTWVTLEHTLRHPVIAPLMFLAPILAVWAYPVVAGIVYFSRSVPSDDLTVWIFRLTLISLFFSGLPVAIFTLTGTLASPNASETMRRRQLLSSSGSLLQVGLYLSLLFWSFGVVNNDRNVGGSVRVFSFSPLIVGIILTYFVSIVLIPYAVGTVRARRQELTFLRAHESVFHDLVVALERPHAAYLAGELDRAKSKLDTIEYESMLANPIIALGEKRSRLRKGIHDALPLALRRTGWQGNNRIVYARMRETQKGVNADEPRLRFWAQLRLMREVVDEIAYTLERVPGSAKQSLQAGWAGFLTKRHDELVSFVAARPRTRIPAWLTVSGIAAPVVSVGLDQFGNWVWTQVAQSLPT